MIKKDVAGPFFCAGWETPAVSPEQIALGACEGGLAWLLAVLQGNAGCGSCQLTSCHGEVIAAKWEMSVHGEDHYS